MSVPLHDDRCDVLFRFRLLLMPAAAKCYLFASLLRKHFKNYSFLHFCNASPLELKKGERPLYGSCRICLAKWKKTSMLALAKMHGVLLHAMWSFNSCNVQLPLARLAVQASRTATATRMLSPPLHQSRTLNEYMSKSTSFITSSFASG